MCSSVKQLFHKRTLARHPSAIRNGEVLTFFVSGLMFLQRLAESGEQDDIRIVVAGSGECELPTVFGPGIGRHKHRFGGEVSQRYRSAT